MCKVVNKKKKKERFRKGPGGSHGDNRKEGRIWFKRRGGRKGMKTTFQKTVGGAKNEMVTKKGHLPWIRGGAETARRFENHKDKMLLPGQGRD